MTSHGHLAALREIAERSAATVADLTTRLGAATRLLATLSPADRPAWVRQQRLVAQLTEALTAALGGATADAAGYRAALDALPAALDPTVPCALLPVRLETRLRARTDGQPGDELVCRIYPDDIHLDGHDPTLTETEIILGTHYWEQRSAGNEDAAWAQLAARLTAPRAAWVARQLTPGVLPLPEPRGPDGRPTVVSGLPDRWVVRLWRDGRRIGESRGELIPRPLPIGPLAGPWTTDLAAALKVGMAVVVRPDPPVPLDRVDLVTAVGVRGSDTPDDSAVVLRDLFDAHLYAARLNGPGLDLVPAGTPTNNTPAFRSPNRRDAIGERAAGSSLGPRTAEPGDGSGADLLAAALGLPLRDPDPAGPDERFVLGRLEHGADPGQRDAADLATVLWPATWGYYLREFLPEVSILGPGADLSGWRRFVVDTVRGRGPLPALRVGDQPYGVLPVLPLADRRPWPDRPDLVVATPPARRGGPARLRIGWDLDATGAVTRGWTDAGEIPLEKPVTGFDLAAGALGGRPVLVALTISDGLVAYRVGGLGGDWGPAWPVEVKAARATVALTPAAALVVAAQTVGRRPIRPGLADEVSTLITVGTGLSADGAVENWSAPVRVPDSERLGRLAGAAAAGGDLVLAYVRDTELLLQTGQRLRDDGEAEWAEPRSVPLPEKTEDATASIALTPAGEVVAWVSGADGRAWYSVFTLADDGGAVWWHPEAGAASIAVASLGAAPGGGLLELLSRARADWANATAAVPRIGRQADPTDDLLDLFAADAVSGGVRVRGLLGPVLLANMWLASGRTPDLARYDTGLWQQARALLHDWGLLDPAAPDAGSPVGKPRLGRSGFEEVATEFTGPLATDASAATLTGAAAAKPDELERLRFGPDDGLLDRLVRHATMQAWADAGVELLPPATVPLLEPELVDLNDLRTADPVSNPFTWTAWRHLRTREFPAGHQWQGRLVWEGVAGLLAQAEQGIDLSGYGAAGERIVELAELRAALARLASRPADVLAWTLAETLDVSAYRLDAWLTAVATERLRALRAARPEGVHLGGYGFVVDLRRRTGPASEGYLHAPSVGQATTAAVLHAAHLAHAGDPGTGPKLAIDLTSKRVRDAADLAAGVRTGQPLGALLGYRFERALHTGLGRYLPALRQLYPMATGKLTDAPDGTPVADLGATDVVDGLALLRAELPWGITPSGADIALPARASADGAALDGLIEALRESVDALGDLLVAESVHQLVNGNPAGAGGALDALAGGDVPAPDPDVLRTPRAGIGVTHRLLVALPDSAPAGWADRPASLAQPRLNAWVATLLPGPDAIRWRTGAGDTYSVADLGLCPLDLLYLAQEPADGDTDTSDRDARSELERLLAHHAGWTADLVLDRAADWTAEVLSVPEALELCAAARAVVTGARPATADDLAGPRGLRGDPDVDLTGTASAATDAVAALTDALDRLRAPFEGLLDLPAHLDLADPVLASGLPADPAAVRAVLVELTGYRIERAAPGAPDDPVALAEQCRRVAAEVALRLGKAAASAGDPVAVLVALFGDGFVVVPPVRSAGSLAAASGGVDDGTLGSWLEGAALVRAGAARLADLRLLAGAASSGAATSLRLAQLPAGDWAGGASVPVAGTIAMVFLGQPPKSVAALLVDEWVEVVPSARQDTAVTFHLDAPDACAPQSVLLAVAGDPTRGWDHDSLERVVIDTLDLARARAVDLDLMAGAHPGHFLPALLFARNDEGATVSTDFPSA
ncbi:hypothetical protein DFJ67_5998 [Asanoa ferruginea]|uniref:Uncharacterized protein n=1 Tax=Asanoa ferruginea TaxID=53367 RepID=A0A3D9ZRV2_9ACTN|nr:hypothetical protein [Asanoa ferruginea]REF99951.1 hypothetical protein DFJ67_5998 [Asanoa ferruginea]GIF53171.1 hypothetical protein Afe04nite_77100 [Asanoa ferruginea]